MGFLDLLKSNPEKPHFTSQLHEKIASLLQSIDEEEITKIACISGLMAHVAYADLKYQKVEIEVIKESLAKLSYLTQSQIEIVTKISFTEVKELCGLDNYKYCAPLNKLLSENERYQLLEILFLIAASDGNAEHIEAEEIRVISNALNLSKKHFLSARATVIDRLGALK